jgi:hypothetical protein
VNLFKISFIFILFGFNACQLERSWGGLPILEYAEAKEIFANRHKIYKRKTMIDTTIIPCLSCRLFNGLHTDVWEIGKIKKNYLIVFPILAGLEGQFSKPYKFKFKKE